MSGLLILTDYIKFWGLISDNCYNDSVIKNLKHGTTGIGISGNTSETECIGDIINKIFRGV